MASGGSRGGKGLCPPNPWAMTLMAYSSTLGIDLDVLQCRIQNSEGPENAPKYVFWDTKIKNFSGRGSALPLPRPPLVGHRSLLDRGSLWTVYRPLTNYGLALHTSSRYHPKMIKKTTLHHQVWTFTPKETWGFFLRYCARGSFRDFIALKYLLSVEWPDNIIEQSPLGVSVAENDR